MEFHTNISHSVGRQAGISFAGMLREDSMPSAFKKTASVGKIKGTSQKLWETKEKIKNTWIAQARQEIPSLMNHDDLALTDSIPEILDLLIAGLQSRGTLNQETEKLKIFVQHAESRGQWTNYSATQVMAEQQILRQVIMDVINEREAVPYTDMRFIQDFIDQGIRITTTRFSQIEKFHETLEITFLKLIEKFVLEVSNIESIQKGLEHLLGLLTEGLQAEVAAILIFRKETFDLELSTASGSSRTLAEKYKDALAISQFALQTSKSQNKITISKVEELPAELKRSISLLGLKTVLGVKIQSHSEEIGILCIGFKEAKSFEPIELNLLGVLSDRLLLLLNHVRIYDQARDTLASLKRSEKQMELAKREFLDEQNQRDRMISSIVHDIRNPLTSAKMNAELISFTRTKPVSAESLANQIIRSINRTDRMISDLLDSSQIKAGKRLSLKIEPFDMTALVHEVIEGLKPMYGDRFILLGEAHCFGYWSIDGMRRVLENLLTNAVKYGAEDQPITITVKNVDLKMVLSIHNEGTAISEADQAKIFEPFHRASTTEKKVEKKGWGIGLTLVRGIIDAHGGLIKVQSTPSGGTTFTVENPMDSRPFQETNQNSQ